MNCRQARNLFSAYWDDEITQGEREWLESHFSSCAACRREYESLARTLEAVSDLPRVEVSGGFAERALAVAVLAATVGDGERPVRTLGRVAVVGEADDLLEGDLLRGRNLLRAVHDDRELGRVPASPVRTLAVCRHLASPMVVRQRRTVLP